MKRNALTEAIQALEHADDRLMEMATAYANARSNGEISEAQWKMQKWESMNSWKAAIDTFDDKRVVVNLVCDKPSVDALKVASKGMRANASKLFKSSINGYDEMGTETQQHIVAVFKVARKELGIDAEEEDH
jgi:hypothetical protein